LSRLALPVAVSLVVAYLLWSWLAPDRPTRRAPEPVPIETVSPPASGSAALPDGHPPLEEELPAGHPPLDGGLPDGHPPLDEAMAGPAGGLALPASGPGSVTELSQALASLPDGSLRTLFDESFRLTFTTSRGRRDYARARAGFRRVLDEAPDHAPSFRGLAYVELNTTFDLAATAALYEKAVDVDPDYAEAHYALAFRLAESDHERGAHHYARALELGLADDQGLGPRYYPEAP